MKYLVIIIALIFIYVNARADEKSIFPHKHRKWAQAAAAVLKGVGDAKTHQQPLQAQPGIPKPIECFTSTTGNMITTNCF